MVSLFDYVVDIDLEKFFDRVNHDILMSRLASRIDDKRLLRIIRRFLTAGMMENGVVMQREEGTPQGGPWDRCRELTAALRKKWKPPTPWQSSQIEPLRDDQ